MFSRTTNRKPPPQRGRRFPVACNFGFRRHYHHRRKKRPIPTASSVAPPPNHTPTPWDPKERSEPATPIENYHLIPLRKQEPSSSPTQDQGSLCPINQEEFLPRDHFLLRSRDEQNVTVKKVSGWGPWSNGGRMLGSKPEEKEELRNCSGQIFVGHGRVLFCCDAFWGTV